MSHKNCPSRLKNRTLFFVITTIFLILSFGFLLSDIVYAQTAEKINLQGKIVRNDTGYEGLNVETGSPACVASGADTCDFQVKYYDASTGGTLEYTEVFTDVEIGDYNGVFNLSLGSVTGSGNYSDLTDLLSNEDTIYLQIEFAPSGDDLNYSEVFTRTQLNASAYAIRSKVSEGSIDDSFKFFNSASSSGITTTTGSVYYDTTDGMLKVYNGSGWQAVSDNLWTDGGTYSYLTSTTDDLILGGSTPGTSKFFFDVSEGRLGIGTDTPGASIDIAGASSTISNDTGDITISPAGDLIVDQGNVGIGTTGPAAKLEILADSTTDAGLIIQSSDNASNYNLFEAQYSTGAAFVTMNAYNGFYANTASTQSTTFGYMAARNSSSSTYSVFVGYRAGYIAGNADYITAIGTDAGYNSTKDNMTVVGYWAGRSEGGVTAGNNTMAFGYKAAHNNTGNDILAVGYLAGEGNSGSDSVFIGASQGYGNTTDNRLMIGNNSTISLLDGIMTDNINTSWLNINGSLGVGIDSPSYSLDVDGDVNITSGSAYRINGTDYSQYFINSAGTNGQLWSSDGSGRGTWVDASGVGTDDQTLAEVLAQGNSAGTYDLDMNNNAILNIDWSTSDDGSGSLLDADFLDGQNGSYYLDNTDDQTLAEVLAQGNSAGTYDLDMNNNAILNIDWSTSDDGSGSLLDADLLDNISSGSFLRSDASDSYTSGTLTFNSGTTVDINGNLSIADTSVAFDGASTNFVSTGNFSVNTDDIFVEKSTGEVGIGTATPSYTLDVAGDINTTTGTFRMADTDYGQYFIDSAGTNGQLWSSDGTGRGTWVDASTVGTDTNDYVDSVDFNTGTGVLTLGRTGSLSDLTKDLDGRYLELSGGTLTGDLTVGSTSRAANTYIRALAGDSYNTGFEAYGSSQGTGYLYVGQSSTYGGGIYYNGDGSPAFATGESSDQISFYRKTSGTNEVVFSYPHNSNDVTFRGGITTTTITTGSGAKELGDASITEDDTDSIPTNEQVYDFVIGQGYSTTDGTVTSITAGTGLTATATNPITTSGTISFDYSNTLASNSLTANTTLFGSTGVLFEGSTANTYETLLTVTDPTADRTITLPNNSGTVALTSDIPSADNYAYWRIQGDTGGPTNVVSNYLVDFEGSGGISTAFTANKLTIATSGVLEDLDTLGAATAADQFIVSTGAGVFAYESGSTARTSLGASTVGGNLFTLTNPSAVTFLRVNADNTVSALSASAFRTAIGAGTGDGTVTSVSNSDGTLTISPTTGNVVASLNLGNANTWTAAQTFSSNTYFPGNGLWDSSGKVGIGDASLESWELLKVYMNDTSSSVYIKNENSTSNTESVFRIDATDSNTNAFRVQRNGYVGIGLTTSSYKLDVNGDINIASGSAYRIGGTDFSQYFIDSAGTDDYVWTSDGSGRGGWESISASLLPTGTEGQMLYNNAGTWTAFDGMYWDDTNSRLGIGLTDPSQALELVGSLELEDTTSSTTGVIYKDGSRFVHNFQHPTGGSAVPVGRNVFAGENAGNFTMGSTASSTVHGSYNVGIGYNVLSATTTGHENTAIGAEVLQSNTTGYDNVAVGYRSMRDNTGGSLNTASGVASLAGNLTGVQNAAFGSSALASSTGHYNTAVGYYALRAITSGSYNVAMGREAGKEISGGSDNTSSSYSIFLGSESKALVVGGQNEIVIGYNATGLGSNTVTLGNDSITKTALKGNVGIGDTSPASLFTVGSGDLFQVDSSGDMVKIKNVTYSWPSSQGSSNTVLTNNGSGTLTWSSVPGDDWGSDTVQSDIPLTGAGTSGSPLDFNYSATLASNPAMGAGETIFGSTGILFEGATANDYETLLTLTDPTADRTITLPNATGTVALTSDIPAGATYWTRSGTDLYPTTSGDSVIPNGTANIGGSSARWYYMYGTYANFSGSVRTGLVTGFSSLVFRPGTDSTAAMQLQNSSGTNILNVDTTNLRIGIGTNSPGAKLDIKGTSDEVQLEVKGYSTQTNNPNLLQIKKSDDSILLSLNNSGLLTLAGNFEGGTNNSYDIGSTSTRWKDVYTQGTIQVGANGDSGSIRYNTTNDELEFSNDGSNWIPLGDLTVTEVLSAEYAGAVMAADGSSNTGSMTSDAEGSANNSMNYYEWNSSETGLQDYDVRVRYTIPSDFESWATNAFTLNYATEANISTNNKVDIYVYLESSGTVDDSSTGQYSSSAGAWTTTNIQGADLGDCNAAGETCLLLIRMYSANDSYTRIGDIDINYNRKL